MALTESNMLKLGSPLPEFKLPDTVTGKTVESSEFDGSPLLVMFICNHCPYVIHLSKRLAELSSEFIDRGVGVVAISSNDAASYPADSPELMKEEVAKRNYRFPYLYDESQDVAKSFTAACTPDFFLYDEKQLLRYRGRFDETRPKRIRSGVYETEIAAHGNELLAAVNAVLNGHPAPEKQLPSLGCNIKWKPENEPTS